MNKLDLYNYNDFTRKNYNKLLEIAKENYNFRLYTNYYPEESFIIWRHDIDISPHSALKLAKIEKSQGILATYFIHLHSNFYNLLEKEILNIFYEIISLGHSIGLHFESDVYFLKEQNFINELKTEKKFLEKIFNINVQVFSFHNPSHEIIKKYNEYEYGGLINTYSKYFQKKVGYCSDSNGYWRYERLEDVLTEKKFKNLQVLTHPVWWQDEIMSPRKKIQRSISGRAEKQLNQYDYLLRKMGQKNVR